MIKRFEDLEIWQFSMELCYEISQIATKPKFNNDYYLFDQIRRCTVSIPSNIAEGFERDGDKEFIRFLRISKGSAGELRTQLKIANKFLYITDNEFNLLNEKAILVSKKLSGLIKYLQKSIKY